TYTNYGGVVVPEMSFAVITRVDGAYDISAITFDLGDYATISDMEAAINKAVTTDIILTPGLTGIQYRTDSIISPYEPHQVETENGLQITTTATSTSNLSLLDSKG